MTARPMPRAEVERLGFWLFLLSDLVIFGALLATWAVMSGGPDALLLAQRFDLGRVALQSGLLLLSALALALARVERPGAPEEALWLVAALFLGTGFLFATAFEFGQLIDAGLGPTRSGLLSSYVLLVGTHAVHVLLGIAWMAAILVLVRAGANPPRTRASLGRLTAFWHMIGLVWVAIYSVVHLPGSAP